MPDQSDGDPHHEHAKTQDRCRLLRLCQHAECRRLQVHPNKRCFAQNHRSEHHQPDNSRGHRKRLLYQCLHSCRGDQQRGEFYSGDKQRDVSDSHLHKRHSSWSERHGSNAKVRTKHGERFDGGLCDWSLTHERPVSDSQFICGFVFIPGRLCILCDRERTHFFAEVGPHESHRRLWEDLHSDRG